MSDTIAIKKSTFHLLLAALVVVLMTTSFLAGYSIGSSGRTAQIVAAPSQNGGTQQPQVPSRISVSTDDDPVKGAANAKVTVIEFSDFQCPFCSRFFSQSFGQIEKDYIDTGKVLFVYRDFPLDSIHPQAVPGALAANCANEQGKFWEYHDKIFQNQESMSDASYKAWAAELGLNTQQFNQCYDSKKYQSEVQKDFQDGAAAGVSGTPTFFIGSPSKGYQQLVGAQPFAVIKQVIDAELAAA